MSEYQYYEFRAIDRPLTKAELSELRAVSSRGEMTPTSYTNEYHYGDFRGNPEKWMVAYFDAFVYYANWGTKTLKLRFPKSVLSDHTVSPYCGEECLSVRATEEHTIVTFNTQPYDDPEVWVDDSGAMDSLIDLRAELAQGDLRCLYLGWLMDQDFEYLDDEDAEDEEDPCEDDYEPTVPAGLLELTESQQYFVEFFRVDPDLLAAAASASSPIVAVKQNANDLGRWIANLPEVDKNAYLHQVLGGAGGRVALELESRFQKETAPSGEQLDPPKVRTVRELQALKLAYRVARVNAEQARAAAAKKERLDDIARRLPDMWAQIESQIDSKQIKGYDLAVKLLQQIEELAERGDVGDFANLLATIRARNSTKPGLLARLQVFK